MALELALGICLAAPPSRAIFFPFSRECRWHRSQSGESHWWQLHHGEVKDSRLLRAAALLPLSHLSPSLSFALWCQQLPADFLAYQASFFLLANSGDPLYQARLSRKGLSSLFPGYYAFPLQPQALQVPSGLEGAVAEFWSLLSGSRSPRQHLTDQAEWVSFHQVARMSPHFWVYSLGKDYRLGVCFLDQEQRLSCWTAGWADQWPKAMARVDYNLRFYQRPSLPPVSDFIPLFNRNRNHSTFSRFSYHEIPYPQACSVTLKMGKVHLKFHHHPGTKEIQDLIIGTLNDLSQTRRLRPRQGVIELFFLPTTTHHQWVRVEGKREHRLVWIPWNYWPLDWWVFWSPRISLSRVYTYTLRELDPEVPLSVLTRLLYKLVVQMPIARGEKRWT